MFGWSASLESEVGIDRKGQIQNQRHKDKSRPGQFAFAVQGVEQGQDSIEQDQDSIEHGESKKRRKRVPKGGSGYGEKATQTERGSG